MIEHYCVMCNAVNYWKITWIVEDVTSSYCTNKYRV